MKHKYRAMITAMVLACVTAIFCKTHNSFYSDVVDLGGGWVTFTGTQEEAVEEADQYITNMLISQGEIVEGINDPATLAKQNGTATTPATPSTSTTTPAATQKQTKKVKVCFTDMYGKPFKTIEVKSGDVLTDKVFPTADVPAFDGYTFKEWDYDDIAITSDWIVRAVYTKN